MVWDAAFIRRIGVISMIIYENHHILVKVYDDSMYYFVKEGKDRRASFPRRYKVALPELLDYIVKYHRNVEPRLKDMQ